MPNSDGPPRALVIAAVTLAVTAIGVILAIAATRHAPPAPVAIPGVAAPQATSPDCEALMAELPKELGDYERAPLGQPAPRGASAWRAGRSIDPVILRCGLERPVDFVVGSPIQNVDRVQWFEVPGDGSSTWYTVDRPVYVALTLPAGSGPTPIQQVSEVIDRVIKAVPIDPGPAH